MRLRTPKDLGATIRARRRALGLDQASLAARARVSRLWINQVEAGKPGASVGLVLRTFAALGIELDAIETASREGDATPGPDINAIVARGRKRS